MQVHSRQGHGGLYTWSTVDWCTCQREAAINISVHKADSWKTIPGAPWKDGLFLAEQDGQHLPGTMIYSYY